MNGGSGPPSFEPLALYVPAGYFSKTCPDSLTPTATQDVRWDAYAAGLVDGEGALWVQKGRLRQLYPAISIQMVYKAQNLLQEMTRYGGYFYKSKDRDARHAQAFRWQITGRPALAFLQLIYPYLQVKRQQAALLLELGQQMTTLRKKKNGHSVWTPETYLTALKLKTAVSELNRRGPEHARNAVGDFVFLPMGGTFEEVLSPKWSVDWPKSGLMRAGRIYRLPTSARRTSGNGSGSSPHRAPFPTPSSVSYGSSGNGNGGNTRSRGRPSLETMAKRLPTPRAQDASHSQATSYELAHRQHNVLLHMALAQRLPTPMAADATGSRGSKGKDRPDEGGLAKAVKLLPTPKSEPSGPDYARANRPESGGDDLATMVARTLLPTPASRDYRHPNAKPYAERGGGSKGEQLPNAIAQMLPTPSSSNRDNAGGGNSAKAAKERGTYISGQLNPTFVEAMMGYPPGWTEAAYSPTRGSRASRPSPSASATGPTGSAPSGTPSSPPAPTRSSGRSKRRETR